MVKCTMWEGSYNKSTDYGEQFITEYVVATQYGVIHLKSCTTLKTGRNKLFCDLDAKPIPRWGPDGAANRELIKSHYQWGRTRREVTKGGGQFMSSPWSTTEDAEVHRKLLPLLATSEQAKNAWQTICGASNDFPRYSDIVEKAEEIVTEARQAFQVVQTREMMKVDETWGMF